MIITAALALACGLVANKFVGMIRGGLKDLLTVTATVIFHQAAPWGNERGFSLEAPLNVTRAPTSDEAGVYQTARVLFFLQPAHNITPSPETRTKDVAIMRCSVVYKISKSF